MPQSKSGSTEERRNQEFHDRFVMLGEAVGPGTRDAEADRDAFLPRKLVAHLLLCRLSAVVARGETLDVALGNCPRVVKGDRP